jgi:hypothetical protein
LQLGLTAFRHAAQSPYRESMQKLCLFFGNKLPAVFSRIMRISQCFHMRREEKRLAAASSAASLDFEIALL